MPEEEAEKKPAGLCTMHECKRRAWSLAACLGIAAGGIAAYSLFLEVTKLTDVLNSTLFYFPGMGPVSWWPVLHFVMYVVLGYAFPECWYLLLLASVGWELCECTFGSLVEAVRGVRPPSGASVQYTRWWDGSYVDLIMNTVGMLAGIALSKARAPHNQTH